MTTMKQPFQCNVQPEIQEPHRTTHTDTTTRCKTHRPIRAETDRSRTGRTDEVPFIVGCSHFTRKKTRFGAPASSPHTAHATSCSNSNAICNQRFKNRIELRTQTQPLVAKHIGGTIRAQNDPSRNRRTDEVAFIAGCSHFTRKNARFGAPASSPTHSPCNIMQPLQCVSQHPVANPNLSTHVATSNDDNEAAIPMQSATRDSRTA